MNETTTGSNGKYQNFRHHYYRYPYDPFVRTSTFIPVESECGRKITKKHDDDDDEIYYLLT